MVKPVFHITATNKINACKLLSFLTLSLLAFTLACLISCSQPVLDTNNYNKNYTAQEGGTLIDATIGEPSGLIYSCVKNGERPQCL